MNEKERAIAQLLGVVKRVRAEAQDPKGAQEAQWIAERFAVISYEEAEKREQFMGEVAKEYERV